MKRSYQDWIEENGQAIHCLSMAAADVLFSASMIAKGIDSGAPTWWLAAKNAIDATAQLYSCLGPGEDVYKAAFEGENKHCQCAEVGGELFLDFLDADGNRLKVSSSDIVEAKQITDAQVIEGVATCNWITVDGDGKIATVDLMGGSKPIWYIVPTLNTGCCSGTPSPPPVQPRPKPYYFGDEEGDCFTRVTLIDSCIDKYGFHQNFYQVWENTSGCGGDYEETSYYWETIEGPYLLNKGGRTWPYMIYSKPPYAWPHPHAPQPSGGGSQIPGLSPVQYRLDVGCSYNTETEDFDKKYFFDVDQTDNGILGLAKRMDALALMINNAQLLPYTDCASNKPELEGDWVTINWISDEPSPDSRLRLRKRTRYRSKSDRDSKQLQQYFRDFVWLAGSACVRHEGAWWGSPQVWARDADEGKRVLRHLAGEAGLDPDQVGRWAVSSSRNPRFGQEAGMTVRYVDGMPWVSRRSGSNMLPM